MDKLVGEIENYIVTLGDDVMAVMKRSVLVVITVGILSLLFGGCASFEPDVSPVPDPIDSTQNTRDPSVTLERIYFSQNAMDRTSCYNFSLKIKPNTGTISFDAWCIIDREDFQEVNIQDCSLPREEWDAFLELAEEIGLENLEELKKQTSSPSIHIADATTQNLTLYWSDGSYEKKVIPKDIDESLWEFMRNAANQNHLRGGLEQSARDCRATRRG